jgi:hypothetical protein
MKGREFIVLFSIKIVDSQDVLVPRWNKRGGEIPHVKSLASLVSMGDNDRSSEPNLKIKDALL